MLCCKCKKREAVVFISKIEDSKTVNEGYCMVCARDLGISQINGLLNKIKKDGKNIDNEKYIKDLSEQFKEVMGEDGEKLINPDSLSMMNNMMKSIMGITKNLDEDAMNQFDFSDFRPEIDEEDNKNQSDDSEDKSKIKFNKKKNKKRKYLKTYGEDLTAKAADGRIDKVIGREREIDRVIQILNRRTKNNPCLIGEPGVGKTAIAEGLALKIVEGEVPPKLLEKEVYLLDLTALIAGTQFRGQFEGRIKSLISEVKEAGNIILFIDEVHNLVGTGDAEGTMSIANILKPALSRGEIQVIGATTFNEYRKHIEKDSALERRFQPVVVNEPTINQTVEILLGIKEYYEKYHNVTISENIVKKAVVFSERYINDRFLPDKAIDLLDEACSCASLSNEDLNKFLKLKKDVNKNNEELEYLESQEVVNYEEVATVKAQVLKAQEEIDSLEKHVENIYVNEDHLAKVIELWTGIPALKIKQKELKKLSTLESDIKKKIIGQDEAVKSLVKAVKRSKVQIRPNIRPASFIFVGPTGVGKTKLAQVLADELFDGVDNLIRLDMSEYMEKFSVSRIIGSPPGYVGYDDAGQLTEKVRRRPYSVVLFDEIEKAHPDVMNILLQILDNGKITDSQGRQVSFENTIIIMTSNAGSQNNELIIGFNKTQNQIVSEKSKKALSAFLKPEFLARVDEIITFRKLDVLDYERICKILLDELKNDAFSSKNIKICYNEKILSVLARKAYSEKSGARDIQRIIKSEIEDKLCEIVIDNINVDFQEVFFDVDKNEDIIYNFH